MEEHLVSTVQSHLQLGLYENATFLCERLVAAASCEAHKYLLAQCYRHCRQEYRAIRILEGHNAEHCRYLVALCCLELKRFQEAEHALTRLGDDQVPCGAAGLYLLGLIHQRTCREGSAAEYYQRALQLDPLMWSAYVAMCALGKDAAASAITSAHWSPSAATAFKSAVAPAAAAQAQQLPLQQSQASKQQQQQRQQEWGKPPGARGDWSEAQAFSAMSIDGVTPTPVLGWGPAGNGGQSSTGAAAGPGRAYDHQQLLPQVLPFATPSPGPDATPLLPPGPSKAAPAAGFPGFATPSPAAGAAGLRTPMLGKQKGGAAAGGGEPEAARRNKVSKAAGRLFGGDSSATPRRSARLAAHQHHPQDTPAGPASNPPGAAAGSSGQAEPLDQEQQQLPMDLDGGTAPATTDVGAAAAAGGGAPVKGGSWQQQQQQQRQVQQQQKGRQHRGGSRQHDHHHQQHHQQQAPAEQHPGAADSAAAVAAVAHSQLAAVFGPLECAARHASHHRSSEALEALQQLDSWQWGTAQVQVMRGEALYEAMRYKEAMGAFEAARKLDPYCLQGMEIYSSVLWHLQREVELAHLAEELLAVDRLSPYAWCVAGNCFSLQREHEAAIRCLQRALQLAPHLAYAATLMGHEHLALEDLGAALVAFQAALRADPRHYAALYGIGQIYLRQEKHGPALHHFQLALRLKPAGSILHHCCGTALARLNRTQEAVKSYSAAVAADPKNGVARYDRAQQLLLDGRLEEALQDALALQDMAPREYLVHMLLGRLYRRLGQTEKGLAAFSAALDLSPSSSDKAAIKAAMDRIHQPDDDEEEEM